MTDFSPHTTILGLQQKLDQGLDAIYASLGLAASTERILTVDRATIDGLSSGAQDPQSALVQFPNGPEVPALVVAEPALCSTVLARMWGSSRNHGSPLTQVEAEIVRQHLSDVVRVWRGSWKREGIGSLPELSMGGPLSMLRPQLVDGTWYIARTVVLDQGTDEAVGVLLFCYPAPLMPMLTRELRSTRWRSRIERTLTDAEYVALRHKLHNELKPLAIDAPVKLSTTLPLRMINGLERGDVIAFDVPVGGATPMSMLDRDVVAGLARSGPRLALRVHDVPGVTPTAPAEPVVQEYQPPAEDPLASPEFP